MDNKDESVFDVRKKLKNDEEKVNGLYEVNIEKYNKELEQDKMVSKIRRVFLAIILIPMLSFLIPLTVNILKKGDNFSLVMLVPFWLIALLLVFVGFIKKN